MDVRENLGRYRKRAILSGMAFVSLYGLETSSLGLNTKSQDTQGRTFTSDINPSRFLGFIETEVEEHGLPKWRIRWSHLDDAGMRYGSLISHRRSVS
jgi:hypothetical protein